MWLGNTGNLWLVADHNILDVVTNPGANGCFQRLKGGVAHTDTDGEAHRDSF
jgi:hypothetical protein